MGITRHDSYMDVYTNVNKWLKFFHNRIVQEVLALTKEGDSTVRHLLSTKKDLGTNS